MTQPALALLEFTHIAAGIAAADAMVKRAPVERLHTGTIQPGRFLVLVVGDVASVEEAVAAGREMGGASLCDEVYLPNVHPGVVAALNGRRDSTGDALGIIETHTVAAAIIAADAGLKGAEVTVWQLRLGDGLGGKGIVFFTGFVADVEAAVDIAAGRVPGQLLQQLVIAQLHDEMRQNMGMNGRFGEHFGWQAM
jgi:microcompartment protein CcmL/EutN